MQYMSVLPKKYMATTSSWLTDQLLQWAWSVSACYFHAGNSNTSQL